VLNGLFEIPVVVLARTAPFTGDIRSALGVIVALAAALLAAYGSWHITGRVISWRERAGQDEA
jgi:hypothetical protein